MSPTKRNVREEEWAKNAPDYFVEGVQIMVEAREEAKELLASLNQRESDLRGMAQLLGEREGALIKAVGDMQEFANRIYGPDSEITRIHARLDELPRLHAVEQRLNGHDGEIEDIKSRVTELEKQRKVG